MPCCEDAQATLWRPPWGAEVSRQQPQEAASLEGAPPAWVPPSGEGVLSTA